MAGIKEERWRESNIFIAYGWSIGLWVAFVIDYSMASSTMFQVLDLRDHLGAYRRVKLLLVESN